MVGDTNHRWYTLEGAYTNLTADLEVVLTQGGIFNDSVAVNRVDAGDATLTFDSCTTATLTYTLDESGLTGSIPLTRLSGDNVDLCVTMSNATE